MARRPSANKAAEASSSLSPLGSRARVYHPTLNTYRDVDNTPDTLQPWLDEGWTDEPGDHNQVDGYPAVQDTEAAEVEAAAKAKDDAVPDELTDPSQQ